MKNALRILGLATILTVAVISNAHAGTCKITCTAGGGFSGSTSTGSQCCSKIDTLCNGSGHGTYNGAQCAL
jgi:hypothetical protein